MLHKNLVFLEKAFVFVPHFNKKVSCFVAIFAKFYAVRRVNMVDGFNTTLQSVSNRVNKVNIG